MLKTERNHRHRVGLEPRFLFLFISLLSLVSCDRDPDNSPDPEATVLISAVDISSYPEIAQSLPVFYDEHGQEHGFLSILTENGINTIRLRLWVNPDDGHSGLPEVKELCETVRNKGFDTWITVHYSDTWADPAQQETPTQWQGLSFTELKDSVIAYTRKVATALQPTYIQIGNEINSGFLHPYGHLSSNFQQFTELLDAGIASVRATAPETKIMLHYAGLEAAEWFFNQMKAVDYDLIGLSYYPIWHGKSLTALTSTMQSLSDTHNKDILIAETAYPFTLEWNDWTDNIVGEPEQLILPDYPATPTGQQEFIKEIRSITHRVERVIGFCYWGAELIAWEGNQSTDASPWENQALFDFENKALPVLEEFQD